MRFARGAGEISRAAAVAIEQYRGLISDLVCAQPLTMATATANEQAMYFIIATSMS